nr:HAD family hydrolase [Bacteroidales bacterium]
MALKAVVLDLDGTLYSKCGLPTRLIMGDLIHLPAIYAERRARKALQGRYFASSKEYYDALFNTMASGHPAKAERYRAWFWNRYLPDMVRLIAIMHKFRPNIKTFIDAFHSKGLKVAILSDYPMTEPKLKVLGLKPEMFEGIYETPEMGGLKPCHQTFLSTCQALGVTPDEAIMIGDKENTDGGAAEVGMSFRHVTSDDEWNSI